jgi:hypothetical protein
MQTNTNVETAITKDIQKEIYGQKVKHNEAYWI